MLNLRKYGDAVLREKCSPVKDKGSRRVKEIIAGMAVICNRNGGLGLSAPQVGIAERVVLIDMTPYGGTMFAMVNPVILDKSADYFYSEEGCLSFPGKFAEIKRSKSLLVEFYDERGKKKKIRTNGLVSVAIQHEIDHLDGVLFIDHIDDDRLRQSIQVGFILGQ